MRKKKTEESPKPRKPRQWKPKELLKIAKKLPPLVRVRMIWWFGAMAENRYARHILNTQAPSFSEWFEKKGKALVAAKAEQGHSGAMALLGLTATPEEIKERGRFWGLPPVVGGISGPNDAWVASGNCSDVCEHCNAPLFEIEFVVQACPVHNASRRVFCSEDCAKEAKAI